MIKINRVVHFDITADDPERAVKFYTDVFGWKITKWDAPADLSDDTKSKMDKMGNLDYWMVVTGDDSSPGINGGLSKRSEKVSDGSFNAFACTIGVDDVEGYSQKIKDAGGKILSEKMPIPGMGWFIAAEDTEKNHLGILQEDSDPK